MCKKKKSLSERLTGSVCECAESCAGSFFYNTHLAENDKVSCSSYLTNRSELMQGHLCFNPF